MRLHLSRTGFHTRCQRRRNTQHGRQLDLVDGHAVEVSNSHWCGSWKRLKVGSYFVDRQLNCDKMNRRRRFVL